ncbi:28947_t:CDS:1, partial [Racocetra persica]
TFQHNDREINKYQLFTDEESFNNLINQKCSSEQTLVQSLQHFFTGFKHQLYSCFNKIYEFYLIPNYHTGENIKDGIEDIEKHLIESLSIVKDIKRSDLSIDYLNDITIEDDKKILLLESFNYYLKKDKINNKSLDIDDLKIPKYLNEIIGLQNPLSLCSEINDLQ